MALGFRQEQRQTQKLVMTPQMQQSIQLLQMSMLELEQVALQEVAENPFLELADDTEEVEEEQRADALGTPEAIAEDPNHLHMGMEDPPAPSGETTDEGDWDSDEHLRLDNASLNHAEGDDAETLFDLETADSTTSSDVGSHLDDVDCDWETTWDGSENRVYTPLDPDEEDRDFAATMAKKESLIDRLMWQLRVSLHGDKNLRIGTYIIGSLDEDGYLRAPMAEVAIDCDATVEEVEGVLRVIQMFDPVGVAARSLTESLSIQLRQRGFNDPILLALVTDHLDGLQKKKFRELARVLDVSEARIREAFAVITSLDPRPGAAQNAAEVQPVLPDVLVQEIDGRYVVMLNEGRMGGLRVNEYYRSLLKGTDLFANPTDKEFANEKLRGALWLIRNIERRKNTIIRVAEAIVDFQQAFFQKGPSGLRPLTLREVADVVGMHESTVARVTSSKYMDTPRGIFELKFFFSPGLTTVSGDDASSTAIKDALQQMIAGEDPRNPLSDQKISELFALKGVNIARRTVAKYRDQLHILSAKQRKAMNQATQSKGKVVSKGRETGDSRGGPQSRTISQPARGTQSLSYDWEETGAGESANGQETAEAAPRRLSLAEIIALGRRNNGHRMI
jgi:RNA polymerase sigma-54 factor